MEASAVSVVIPTYNRAHLLPRAITSAIAAIAPGDEILVVDDGSTDRTAEAVAPYGDRVRFIPAPHGGAGPTRNRGIREARCPLVAFLDSDDEWLPAFLERSLACLTAPGADVACVTWGYVQHPEGRSMQPLWRRRQVRDGVHQLTPESDPRLAVHLLAYHTPVNTVVRTDVVRRWGGFFDRGRCVYGEDSFLWLKVLLNERVAFWLNNKRSDDRDANTIRKNFLAYLKFLREQKKGEVVAHLASLLEEKRFSRAMAMLAVSAPIITELTEYVKGIEVA